MNFDIFSKKPYITYQAACPKHYGRKQTVYVYRDPSGAPTLWQGCENSCGAPECLNCCKRYFEDHPELSEYK